MANDITQRRRYQRSPSAETFRSGDESSLPVSTGPRRRRTQKRETNNCIRAIALFCMAQALQHMYFFFSYTDDSLEVIHYPAGGDAPEKTSTGEMSRQLESAKLNRRKRTRPLPVIEVSKLAVSSQGSVENDFQTSSDAYARDSVVAMYSPYPSFPVTDSIGGGDICGHHTTNDRIIISGITSHPAASELALTLANECGVPNILGLSDHLLSSQESSRLEFLYGRIPSFKIKFGVGPLGNRATQDVFESFMPTHVFQFHAKVNEESPFRFSSVSKQLEQICDAIIKTKSKGGTITLLYIMIGLPETKKEKLFEAIASIILGAYRTKYELDARVLHLPFVFGPFEEGSSWLRSDKFVRTVTEMMGLDKAQYNGGEASSKLTKTNSLNMTQPIMSITDAIRSILTSAKAGEDTSYESIPVFSAPKFETTLVNLSKNLLRLLKTPNNDTSILPTLSWNYKRAKPYRDVVDLQASPIESGNITALSLSNTRHHLVKNESIGNTAFSQLERRQHNIFPCVSVCASRVECKPSIWDSIAPIAKNATKHCRSVLYVANFSPGLTVLPHVRESVNKQAWPKESFCQIAFVSSNSTLVKNALKKVERKAPPNSTKEELNGKISSTGWTLVWIDENDESMHQSDLMLPKTNPESILSPNIEFVFYIEPQHYRVIPPLQLCFEITKQMKIRAELKDGLLVPEKHIAFLTHEYDGYAARYLNPTHSNYILQAVKFIIQQNNGIRRQTRLLNFKSSRQNEAYSSSLIWRKKEGVQFQLVDTSLMIYPIHNFRSKQLRCEWYEEQLFWNNDQNRNLEALSLSYVLNRWRQQGRLLSNELLLLGENGEELPPSIAELQKSKSIGENGNEPSQSDIESELAQVDPIHHLKIHTPIAVRKIYSD